MSDVLCLGEVVVDWIRIAEGGANKAELFERHLAGVPANVAVGLARQGLSSAMIGRVGDDSLGHWSKSALLRENVDVSGLTIASGAATRTAYVARLADGERETLALATVGCADSTLCAEDLVESQFERAKALYFGSTALSRSPVSGAVIKALALAKAHNLLVVSDANIWPAMWKSDDECRKVILDSLKSIDVLKVNSAELEFLVKNDSGASSNSDSLAVAVEFRQRHGLPLLVLTQGAQGSVICSSKGAMHIAPFKLELIEAAGAGDALAAAALASLLPKLDSNKNRREQLREMSLDDIALAVKRGNAAGAIVCSRLGALCAMPSKEDVDALVSPEKTTVGTK